MRNRKIQTKKRKTPIGRLAILGGVTLLVCVVAAGFYVYRQSQIGARFKKLRQAGIAAAQSGENVKAIDALSLYLQRYPTDPDALAYFAQARLQVPTENHQDIGDAIMALRNLLKLQPGRIAERRTLLDLYMKAGYMTEAVESADILKEQAGEDAHVLGQKTRALISLRRFGEAITSARDWAQLAPDDFDAQMSVLDIMHEQEQLSSNIIAAGEACVKAHPGDGRFRMVRGYAYCLANDRDSAVNDLEAAAAQSITDDHFAKLLVSLLDGLGKYDDSLPVLQRMQDSGGSTPQAVGALARRYWDLDQPAGVAKVLAGVSATVPSSPDELLALRALALTQLGRDNEAAPIRGALASRRNSAIAVAWSEILDQLAGHAELDPKPLLDACANALAQSPEDPYLSYFQADAYMRIGESDLAIDTWQKVAEEDRVWGLPLIRAADALVQNGRDQSALAAANEARRRWPHNSAALITFRAYGAHARSTASMISPINCWTWLLRSKSNCQTNRKRFACKLVCWRALENWTKPGPSWILP